MFSYEAPTEDGQACRCDNCGRNRPDVSTYTGGDDLCAECAPDEPHTDVCDLCGKRGPIVHKDHVHGIGVCNACSYRPDDGYTAADRKADEEDARRWAEQSKDRS